MSLKFQVTKAAELESLAKFRQLIKDAVQHYPGVDEQTLYDLQLAADEACSNIIEHGYAGLNPGSIIFALEVEGRSITMSITDFGHEFEPSSAPAPDFETDLADRPLGGFGLYFIYQTMDRVEYVASPCGNVLTLTKLIGEEN